MIEQLGLIAICYPIQSTISYVMRICLLCMRICNASFIFWCFGTNKVKISSSLLFIFFEEEEEEEKEEFWISIHLILKSDNLL